MIIYNLKLYKNIYSESELFALIQKLFKNDYIEFPAKQKRLLIADALKYVNTEKLLLPTLDLLEDFEFLPDRNDLEKRIDQIAQQLNLPAEDVTKLKAISFSELMLYTLFLREFGTSEGIPQLQLEFEENAVLSNMDEISDLLRRNAYLQQLTRIEKLPMADREEDLKAAITSMARIDYEQGTHFFKEEKEFFQCIKENLPNHKINILPTVQPLQNPFPEIFQGFNNTAFRIFEEYLSYHIIEPYVDLSFLYQQLKEEGLLHAVPHKEFMVWLNINKFVSEKVFKNLLEYGHFRSLAKCSSVQRMNNWNLSKESILLEH